MIGEQQRQRIVLSVLSAALAVFVVVGSASHASAVKKTRYPGYQGPDLTATCDALDEWEIDTGGYLECGPGADENSDECNAQNVEGCVLDPLPGGPVVDDRWSGQLATYQGATLSATARGDETRVSLDNQASDQGKAKAKGKSKDGKRKGKAGRRR